MASDLVTSLTQPISGLELYDGPAELPARPYDRPRRVVKRLIDVLCAAVLLVLCLPVFVIIAIAIRLDSRGPIFFSQRRLGRDARDFACLKFRSMSVDAETELYRSEDLRHQYVTNHFKIPTHCDPRITRVGRILRKSSLDELPQLLNVLKGDMSLVGPRPIVPVEGTHYGERLPILLSVRPGLTGPWAVGGRNQIGYPDRAEVELEYASSWTLAGDLNIVLQTPWAVITQRGAV